MPSRTLGGFLAVSLFLKTSRLITHISVKPSTATSMDVLAATTYSNVTCGIFNTIFADCIALWKVFIIS
jgi:hypothetical protein